MKIRNGFVTNSSSSSFIVSFDKGSDIRTELEKQMKHIEYNYYLDRVHEDIVDGIVSVEKCEHELADYFWWDGVKKVEKKYGVNYTWECVHDIDVATGEPCSWYKDIWKGAAESEYGKLNDEAWNCALEIARRIISPDENKQYSIVSYDDHMNSDLEHEVMPKLECTVYRMSNH